MDSEMYTLAALALVVAGGWLIDVLSHRNPSAIERAMEKQLKKSADTIHGALH